MTTATADHSRLPQIRAIVDRGINVGVRAAAITVQAKIKSIMGKPGKIGTPSAPGTPPNRQTSALYAAIQSTEAVSGTAYVYVARNIPYARIHEYGGTVQRRIKINPKTNRPTKASVATFPARPYMKPGVAMSIKDARAAYEREMSRYITNEIKALGPIK